MPPGCPSLLVLGIEVELAGGLQQHRTHRGDRTVEGTEVSQAMLVQLPHRSRPALRPPPPPGPSGPEGGHAHGAVPEAGPPDVLPDAAMTRALSQAEPLLQ